VANEAQLRILKDKGVEAWNQWRQTNRAILPDLNDADLRQVKLVGADLSGADLNGADLNGADLRGADLRAAGFLKAELNGCDLTGADLSAAFLVGTHFRVAFLRKANLNNADLQSAEFFQSDLAGADLGGSTLGYTTFADVNLSDVKGLTTVKHDGPSEIGVSTIYLSGGNIPEIFLRGAGVPEDFITYMRSLVGKPLEFYSCFISHSSKDHEFAQRLHADLQAKNVRCWFAPEDLKIGDKFRTRIEESIRVYDKLMVVLSENSIQSPWVEEEVEAALEKERQQNKLVLFPIRLDDAVMETKQAWAASLRRTRHIGEFSNWKDHDRYKKAFDRLLRDLKAESAKAAATRD
jgi:uncharacterized protein YjbI with pentapeptide repeats